MKSFLISGFLWSAFFLFLFLFVPYFIIDLKYNDRSFLELVDSSKSYPGSLYFILFAAFGGGFFFAFIFKKMKEKVSRNKIEYRNSYYENQ